MRSISLPQNYKSAATGKHYCWCLGDLPPVEAREEVNDNIRDEENVNDPTGGRGRGSTLASAWDLSMGRCYHSAGLFMSFTRNPALSGSHTHDLDKGDGGVNNKRAGLASQHDSVGSGVCGTLRVADQKHRMSIRMSHILWNEPSGSTAKLLNFLQSLFLFC